jgi:hypothetical protein
MSRESQVWHWLAKARRSFKFELDMNRIENPAGPGMPDVEGHLASPAFGYGGQFWIELKAAERPAKAATPVRFKIRPKQIAWLERRWRIAGNALLLLQVGSGHSRALYLVPGRFAALVAKGVPEIDLGLHAINGEFGAKLKPEDVIRLAVAK